MDMSNSRLSKGGSGGGGDSPMEFGNWRTQLQPDLRRRIVNKLMDTLRHIPIPLSGQEGLQKLEKIAMRFEEEIYTAAMSQPDYIEKISMKILIMETRFQTAMPNFMLSDAVVDSVNPSDPGPQGMQQGNNHGQPVPILNPSNHPQPSQQLLSQSMLNNIVSTGMQVSSGLSFALPPGSGLSQSTMPNDAGQNSSLQNISISDIQQNSVRNTTGQVVPSNNFVNQRQIPGRQLALQQQLNHNSERFLYQHQLRQIAKQNLHQNSITPPMQSHFQQQILQPSFLQSSQQSVMQPTLIQTSSPSTFQQNQQSIAPQSMQPLIQHPQQSVVRQQRQQQQAPFVQQQQARPILQQPQPQPSPIGQQENATNILQNQLIGQQSSYSDMQQLQQRLLGQQNNISSIQQWQQQWLLGQHPSPQIDQPNLLNSLTKADTPLHTFSVQTPTPSASPTPGEFESISVVSYLSNVGNIGNQQSTATELPSQSLAIGTPGISTVSLLAEFTSEDGNYGNVASLGSGKSNITEQPLEHLLEVVNSIPPEDLSALVSDIGSTVSMIDSITESTPGNGSRVAIGEDSVATKKCCFQAITSVTQDGTNRTRKMKRFTGAMPVNVVSSAGSIIAGFKQLNCATSELDLTATSMVKRVRIENTCSLTEEIKAINQGLIDTVIYISEEDVDSAAAAFEGGDGTVVKCLFSGVALGPDLKSQNAPAQMSPIQPLRILVPANYPKCSPILLDMFPVEASKAHEDLSMKAKSRFSISLRTLAEPVSLRDMARTWEACARAVVTEYAQQSGGGAFSSKFGTWVNC